MKKSLKLLLILIVVGGIIFGVYYLKLRARNNKINIFVESNINSSYDEITANWKTFSDSSVGISFKYPDFWVKPKVENLKKNDNAFPVADMTAISFEDNNNDPVVIYVSDLSQYKDVPKNSIWNFSIVTEKMKSIYSTKTAISDNEILTPSNDTYYLYASTGPQYIETNNATFRGIYTFQSGGKPVTTRINNVINVSNGSNKLVTLVGSKNSDKYPTKKFLESSDSSDSLNVDQKNELLDYVKSLNDTGSETIVKYYRTIYKNIILSLTEAK